MKKELGKIEKPSVEEFEEGRRLYCLPLLYTGENAPDDYTEKFNQYWKEAEEHLVKLEKAGQIDKIYHESIFLAGDEGLKAVKSVNEESYQIIRERCENGAELESLEDKELFYEMMDWARCLSVVIASEKVFNKVSEFYQESQEKRNQAVVEQIDKTLQEGQTGLLIMNEADRKRIQFPSDIHIFTIHPPALEELYQWQKEQRRNIEQQMKEQTE